MQFVKAERWRSIDGFPNYLVDPAGNIFSKKRKKILTPVKDKNGYIVVCLFNNNKGKSQFVHRLVAKAWVLHGKGPIVNHINCCKADNRSQNLEWVTSKMNSEHAISNGLYHRGIQCRATKLNEDSVLQIRGLKLSQRKIAKQFGVGRSAIVKILKRKSWTHI